MLRLLRCHYLTVSALHTASVNPYLQYADPKMAGLFFFRPAIFGSAYCTYSVWHSNVQLVKSRQTFQMFFLKCPKVCFSKYFEFLAYRMIYVISRNVCHYTNFGALFLHIWKLKHFICLSRFHQRYYDNMSIHLFSDKSIFSLIRWLYKRIIKLRKTT